MRIIVTTSRKPTAELDRLAQDWAERLDAEVVPRGARSLRALVDDSGA
jgi:rRNA maturation protein Rpf1